MTLAEKGAFDLMTAGEYNELLRLVQTPYVKKTSNLPTFVSNTTLAADPQITVPISRINATFTWSLWMIINSPTAADFKFGWSVPTGSTMAWSAEEGNPGNFVAVMQGPFIQTDVCAINSTGADQIVKADGQLNVSGVPGNFALMWAQNTSNAGNTNVKISTQLQLWPV